MAGPERATAPSAKSCAIIFQLIIVPFQFKVICTLKII
jgi:hypothetical protein